MCILWLETIQSFGDKITKICLSTNRVISYKMAFYRGVPLAWPTGQGIQLLYICVKVGFQKYP